MASRDGLKETDRPGIFYREHPTRKNGVQKDRQWVIRQTLGGKTRVSTFGWSALAKHYKDEEQAKIEYSVKSFGDACNKADLYRDNFQWNKLNPDKNPLPICRQDEEDAAAELAALLEQQRKLNERKNIPFGTYFEKHYIPLQNDNGKKSVKREQILFDYHLASILAKMAFHEIKPLHVERVKKNMATKGQAPRSIQYALSLIRQVWNQAIRDDVTELQHPVSRVSKPKVNNKRERFYTEDEEALLLAVFAQKSPITYDMAIMSLDTGARWSELAKLKWAQVDIKAETVRLIGTKAGDNRTAHIATKRVLDMLKRRANEEAAKDEPSQFVFPARDGGQQDQVNRVCYRAIKDLGLNDGITGNSHRLCFHSFRHTCASRLAMAGVPLYTIKEIMGHHSITMTERYAHLMPSAMRGALEMLDKNKDIAESTTEPAQDIAG